MRTDAALADSPVSPGGAAPVALSARTRVLLHGPIVPTILRLAWPNVLVMLAQASTGLIETWWLSHLGTDVLAGMEAGMQTFLVLTGLTRPEQVEDFPYRPSKVVDSIADLVDRI